MPTFAVVALPLLNQPINLLTFPRMMTIINFTLTRFTSTYFVFTCLIPIFYCFEKYRLQFLSLSNNMLKRVPSEVFMLTKLETLSLAHNQIDKIELANIQLRVASQSKYYVLLLIDLFKKCIQVFK